jgi:hypothetical protein
MTIVVYEVLTQLIIWLGKLRTKLCDKSLMMRRRHERTFYASNNELAECCDCGLVHVHYPLFGEKERESHFRLVPLRPADYKYKLRIACDPASPSVDELRLDPWTGKPR